MIEFRAAGGADYEVAASLRQEMSLEMGHDYDRESPGWRERFADYFRSREADSEGQLFLAYDNDKPAGMVIVTILRDYRYAAFGRRLGYVNGTFVRPEYRRRGVARRLMELVCEWARAQECSGLRLRTSTAGEPLYEKLGFTPTSEMHLDL